MTPRSIAITLRESTESIAAGLQHGISQLYKLFKNQGFLVERQGAADNEIGGEAPTAGNLLLVPPSL
jgi:hypothetical protein